MSLPLSFKTCCRKSSVKPTLSSMNLIPFSEPLYWKVNPLSQFVISRTSIPASFSMFICNTSPKICHKSPLSLSLSEQAVIICMFIYSDQVFFIVKSLIIVFLFHNFLSNMTSWQYTKLKYIPMQRY